MLNIDQGKQGASGQARLDIPSMAIKTEEMIRGFAGTNAGDSPARDNKERQYSAGDLSKWRQFLREASDRKRHEIGKQKDGEKILKANVRKLHSPRAQASFQMAGEIFVWKRKQMELEIKLLEEMIRRLEVALAKEGMEIFRMPDQLQNLPRIPEIPLPVHEVQMPEVPHPMPMNNLTPPPLTSFLPKAPDLPVLGRLPDRIGGSNAARGADLQGLITLGPLGKKG